MKIFFCLCSLLYSLLSLAQNKPFIVDLEKSNEDVSLNILFDKIEYVPLETTPECFLKPGAYYYVTDKYIVAMNTFWQTYLFDRKTGKFIRGLDREGGGPDEYRRWIVYLNGLNEKRNILYANDIDKWKGYDIETGEMVDIIKKPSINNDIITVFSPWAINSNQYIGNVSAEFCKKGYRLVVFNKQGFISKVYKKENILGADVLSGDGLLIFYNYKGKLYFSRIGFNAMTYEVGDKQILPHIIFRTGNKEIPDLQLDGIPSSAVSDQINILWVGESDRFIFFKYAKGYSAMTTYNCALDKKNKKLYIPHSKKACESHYGYTNDTDGLTSVILRGMNKNGEVYGVLDVQALSEYVKLNGERGMSERGKRLVSNLMEDDNPIVVIATPKK
jgi:hypothetical protein